jgi:hypothetical protein
MALEGLVQSELFNGTYAYNFSSYAAQIDLNVYCACRNAFAKDSLHVRMRPLFVLFLCAGISGWTVATCQEANVTGDSCRGPDHHTIEAVDEGSWVGSGSYDNGV